MTLSVEAESASPVGGFDVRTARCDATRANLRVSGRLGEGGAAVLAQVIDTHLRAGRRFLRLHLGALEAISDEAVEVIAAVHDRLLAARGTMVLTGVEPALETTLRRATPASPLLILPPTAAERRA